MTDPSNAIPTPLQRTCRFWIGRAGSGKTYGCLEAIANELRAQPRGRPLLLLAPEQATAQLERRLATWPGLLGGFTRARVISFSHLVRSAIAAGSVTPPAPMLGDTGRILLLRRALRRERDNLLVFAGSAGQPGLAETIDRTLTELARYGWRPETLETYLNALSPEQASHDALARKLADLTRLWRALEEQLTAGGWATGHARHQVAIEAIARWDALRGCHVWIDGFASFTTQELDLLGALLGHADRAVIALCIDPEALQPAARARIGSERMFENVIATLHELEQWLTMRGWTTVRETLPRTGQPDRYAGSPPLAHLERRVLGRLSPERYEQPPATDDPLAAPIQLIEAQNRQAEVEAVARRIAMICRRYPDQPAMGGVTWRDVGVLTRDLAPYEPLIRSVFPRYGIPFFIDRPRQMTGHPLSRLLLSAIEAIRSDRSGKAVIQYVKTRLTVTDADAAAALENYILAVDPERQAWLDGMEADSPAGQAWQTAGPPLTRLEQALLRGENPAHAIWRLLEDVQARTTLECWITQAREAGDEELALLHEQAWTETVRWLEELEAVVHGDAGLFRPPQNEDDRRQMLDELTALVETALATTRARLIPPTLNQVTVGQVDRSRTPEIHTLFVLGLNEGEFPRLWNEDAILNDGDRRALTDGGRALGPDSTGRRLQEHFLTYIALTRPSHRLVLCRPMVGDDGKPADPSHVFVTVAKAFADAPRVAPGTGAHGDLPQVGLLASEWNRALSEATGRLGTTESAAELAGLLAAGDPLLHTDVDPSQRDRILAGRRSHWAPDEPRLDSGLARAVFERRPRLKVTDIEAWGECPFKFYVKRFLDLKERECAGLDVMKLGSVRHGALEKIYNELQQDGILHWGRIDLDRADALIDEHLAEMRREELKRALRAGRMQELTLETLATDLKLAVRAMRLAAQNGEVAQCSAEWQFGRDGELTVEVDGLNIAITGKVDRIDCCRDASGRAAFFLYDYKSGKRMFSLTRLFGGVDMQLFSYALALLATAGERRPSAIADRPRLGGVFYWPLTAPLLDGEADADAGDEVVVAAWFEKCRPFGIFATDLAERLDASITPGGPGSPAWRFKLTNKGELNRSCTSIWEPAKLEMLLERHRLLQEKMLHAIASGEIAPHPYRIGASTGCDFCGLAALCRRDSTPSFHYRRILPIKRKGAYELFDQFGPEGLL